MKVACTVLEGESGGNPADLLRNNIVLFIKTKRMSKELEERIEKKKQMLRDYLRLSEQWKFKKEDIERMTDMYLDDLNKLMKER